MIIDDSGSEYRSVIRGLRAVEASGDVEVVPEERYVCESGIPR